jgi:hypothetical protein
MFRNIAAFDFWTVAVIRARMFFFVCRCAQHRAAPYHLATLMPSVRFAKLATMQGR